MSFIELDRDDFENSSISLKPKVHFISSSVGGGVTGSEYVSPVRSKCVKSIDFAQSLLDKAGDAFLAGTLDVSNTNPAFDETDAGYIHLLPTLAASVRANVVTDEELNAYLDRYMQAANELSPELRYTKTIDVFRFDPAFKFEPPTGINVTIKNNIRNILMPHHQTRYIDSGFHYANYNTVNFFTASNLPSSAVLMYPDKDDHFIPKTNEFTLTSWVNPRYKNHSDQHYHAGTILHVSSSVCLSLISGSEKDSHGRASSFKVMLQLSHSADIPPSKVNFSDSSWPHDLIITSSNEISYNHWSSVGATWSPIHDNATGSLVVDGVSTRFPIPSASLWTDSLNSDGSAIFVGNYYDGPASLISKFFNQTISQNEGVSQLDSGTTDPEASKFNFSHMANAEFHHLGILSTYCSGSMLSASLYSGPQDGKLRRHKFYLGPYFYPDTPPRQIIQTPFQKYVTSSNDPFNVAFSFGVGGKEINAENFLRDFSSTRTPRLYFMTSSVLEGTVINISADDHVYSSGSILRRNFLILPNDNGLFTPSYNMLEAQASGSLRNFFKYRNSPPDYSKIILEDLVPSSSLYTGLLGSTGSIIGELMGPSPETPGVTPGAVLTIAQRTRDTSSNEVVIYNISNLYYGNRIAPKTFEIIESNLTGSAGKLSFNIRDNGFGSLYRADCLTKHAEWANIGNIFYDEGLAIVKTPHIPYISKDVTELKFSGEHNLHSLIVNVPVAASMLNVSTSSGYNPLPPSDNVSDRFLETTQLTSVNIHDENFNIIMKANFAQPIIKTLEDEFVVRLKEDF